MIARPGAVAMLASMIAAMADGSARAEPELPPPPPPRFAWEPFGYLRLQYLAVQNDPGVLFVGRDDGFELQNARLGVRGVLRDRTERSPGRHAGGAVGPEERSEGRSEDNDRVVFVVAIDGAVDERVQVNAPEGKLRVGLRDAFADVLLGGPVVARAGFFEAMVDPDALVPDTRRELVDRPIESRGMRATEGYQADGLVPGRSLGAAIRIDPEVGVAENDGGVRLGFELAVQNGADEFSSNNDNDKPAVSATVLARLPRGGWAMVAGRYNPRSVGALPFRQDEDDLQGTAGVRVVVGPVALGGGLVVQRTSFPTTGGPAQNAFGGHAQAMIDIPAPLPLAAGYRFGILDPSSLIPTDRVMEHTAGAVLGVPRYRMRVQLQATHVVEQAARGLANDRIQLAAELQL